MKVEFAIQYKPFSDWLSCESPGLGYQSKKEAMKKVALLKQETKCFYRVVEREINDMGLTSKLTVLEEGK